MLVGERRRSVRLGVTPSSGDAGGREAGLSKLSYWALVAGLRTRLYLRLVSVGFWFEGNREDRAVGPAAQPHSCAFPWDLPCRTHRGMTVCEQRRGRKQMSLLSNPQCVQLGLEGAPIDYVRGSKFISHEVCHRSLR